MLTGKQKRFLRSLAQNTKPLMQIGKNTISDNFIKTFNIQLESHELIKVSILNNCFENKDELAVKLCEESKCELVQIIGNQLIFYKESHKNNKEDKIVLPK